MLTVYHSPLRPHLPSHTHRQTEPRTHTHARTHAHTYTNTRPYTHTSKHQHCDKTPCTYKRLFVSAHVRLRACLSVVCVSVIRSTAKLTILAAACHSLVNLCPASPIKANPIMSMCDRTLQPISAHTLNLRPRSVHALHQSPVGPPTHVSPNLSPRPLLIRNLRPPVPSFH